MSEIHFWEGFLAAYAFRVSPELPAIEHDLKSLIDSRLTNPRRNVFDPYFFETRTTHDKESKQGKAELESPKRSKMQQMLRQEAEEELDRRVRNPLATKPFAESGWQVRIKILRQLVDWIREYCRPLRP